MCPTRRKARRSRDLAQMIEQLSDWQTISATHWTSWANQPAKHASCAYCERLISGYAATALFQPHRQLAQRDREAKAEAEKRAAQAKRLWQEAQPIAGTVAEAYLRGRGITCPLPPTLRFHPDAWHGPTARRYPAMVAAVQGAGLPAVHRTYLRADGSGKAGLEDGDKLMLGACAGSAVRLADGPARLVVAEGIESGLSLLCGLFDGHATIWAALSTSGLRGLHLPTQAGRLTIATDGDKPGREAVHALADRAHGLGWKVGILDPRTGADFNDILQERAAA